MLSEESFIRKISKLNFNESVKVLKNGLENGKKEEEKIIKGELRNMGHLIIISGHLWMERP